MRWIAESGRKVEKPGGSGRSGGGGERGKECFFDGKPGPERNVFMRVCGGKPILPNSKFKVSNFR